MSPPFVPSVGLPAYARPVIVRVIVVAPNYRIGPFGFMAHPQLTREGGGLTSPNYGMYDQAEALRWVQRNIAAFGGDRGNVTLFGDSWSPVSINDGTGLEIKFQDGDSSANVHYFYRVRAAE